MNLAIFREKRLLLFLFAAAIFLRLLFIDLKSLHWDEPFSVYLSMHSSFALVFGAGMDLTWPPLYYLLLHFWRMVFGSEIWMRALSVVFGMLSLGAVWFYCRKFFGEKTALIALLLASFSWLNIYYSQEIRELFFSWFFCLPH